MRNSLLLASTLIAALNTAYAEVYKCPGPNGKVLFQQLPCPEGQTITVNAPKPAAGGGIRESEKAVMKDLEAHRAQFDGAIAQAAKEREDEWKRQEALAIERRKAAALEAQARAMWSR